MHHMNGPARGHGGRNIVFTGVVLVAVGCGGLAEAQYSPNIQGGGSTLAGPTLSSGFQLLRNAADQSTGSCVGHIRPARMHRRGLSDRQLENLPLRIDRQRSRAVHVPRA